MSDQSLGLSKFDFLKAKFVFRFPFTFTALKWGLVIGTYIGLHTFIKHRSITKSFRSAILFGTNSSLVIWCFFYTKYLIYSTSISKYEDADIEITHEEDISRKLIERELGLPPNREVSTQDLVGRFMEYEKDQREMAQGMDVLLEGITAQTFDINKHLLK